MYKVNLLPLNGSKVIESEEVEELFEALLLLSFNSRCAGSEDSPPALVLWRLIASSSSMFYASMSGLTSGISSLDPAEKPVLGLDPF